MPKEQEWKTFARWAKEYGGSVSPILYSSFLPLTFLSGDLVYLKVIGKTFISVNSVAVAQDLFQSRSLLYSDRASFPMMSLCVSESLTFAS